MTAPAGGGETPPAGLAVAVDLGTRRVGLATADPTGTIASPFGVLERQDPRFWARLGRICAERECGLLVVGLPRNMDGSEGESATGARSFAADAGERLGIAVEMWDERLSTAEAERSLIAAGMRRADRRRAIDSVAASLILQGYLDAHRPRTPS
jgi:putative Holliday junction resolvase